MAVLMRLFALKQSGHHAIMEWLLDQYQENGCSTRYVDNVDQNFVNTIGQHLPGDLSRSKERSLFLLDLQDHRLETTPSFHQALLDIFECHNVIVLRDPYNLYASRCKRNFDLHVTHYLSYAYEMLGGTKYLGDTLKINYNRWLTDKTYRQLFIEGLGLNFCAEEGTLANMASQGASPFDSGTSAPDATSLLTRWKLVADNPCFLKMIADPRVQDVSRELFQFTPNWDEVKPQT